MNRTSTIAVRLATAFLFVAKYLSVAESAEHDKGTALLVGCTKYDFNESRTLQGPGNDVALMHDVLVQRFGFSTNLIRRLVEEGPAGERPTRANIVREMESLIREAKPGQRIVLFFAGHGCQQPNQVPADPNDPEPDGLDEVFLPCDIGPWNSEIQSIRNAIVDDEFRVWMGKILEKGAELLVIFDSCHSGSACRGGDDEVARRIDPEELIPAAVLAKAVATAEGTRGGKSSSGQAGFDPLVGGKWVALYAALSEELTVEMTLPRNSTSSRKQGLFTYSLCQALQQSSPASYRELIQRVRSSYLAQGKFIPTPLIEGTELERGVLGGETAASSILLEKDTRNQWQIRAGQLHGCTDGSILAVRAANSNKDILPIGYVEVTEAGLSESKVRPIRYENTPANEALPVGGFCRLVYVDYGDQRLKIAIDAETSRGNTVDPVRAMIKTLSGEKDSPIAVVDEVGRAEWLITNRAKPDQQADWVLSPRTEVIETRGLRQPEPRLKPKPPIQFPVNLKTPEKVQQTFQSIARASNLIGLSAKFGNEASDEFNVECEVNYKALGASDSVPLGLDRPMTITKNGKIQIKVTNRGKTAIDFNLLFVDSLFGIQPIFPRQYASDNRLTPGKSFETKPMSVTVDTTGREHIVMIAVPADGAPTNLMFLAQPTLELATREISRGRSGPGHAFEQFLEFAAFRSGNTRGLNQEAQSPVVQVRSWTVEP